MALVDNDIELIVYNYFKQQFALKGIEWTPPDSNRPSAAEENIIDRFVDALSQLTDDFRTREGFTQLIEKMEGVIPNLDRIAHDRFDEDGYVVFSGIAEHLFAEEVRWSHILMLFVFAFELANEYLRAKGDTIKVENIANWLILYSTDRLLEWINTHDFVDQDGL